MEDLEQIKELLSIAGEDLAFEDFTIKGLIGDSLKTIDDYPNKSIVQVFKFEISSDDLQINNIKRGLKFTYTTFNKEFLFKIDNILHGPYGWDMLVTSLEKISYV